MTRLISGMSLAMVYEVPLKQIEAIPVCTKRLSQALSRGRDCFNFVLSSHRIHVEQALGRLTERSRVVLSPLRFSLPHC